MGCGQRRETIPQSRLRGEAEDSIIGGATTLSSDEGLPWAAVLGITLSVVPPLLIGPWAGVWVHRRAWPGAGEGRALLAVTALVVCATIAIDLLAAEPLKQWIAERIGDVDERPRPASRGAHCK